MATGTGLVRRTDLARLLRDNHAENHIALPEMLLSAGLLPHLIAPRRYALAEADMGQISMATRDELVVALVGRYALSNRKERGRILDEFAAVSGLRRKHAMRMLCVGRPGRQSGPRPARRVYSDAVRDALIVLWEASDQVCGKRLRPLVRSWSRQWSGMTIFSSRQRFESLLAMSAATIDRALHKAWEPATDESAAVGGDPAQRCPQA